MLREAPTGCVGTRIDGVFRHLVAEDEGSGTSRVGREEGSI